MTTVDWDKYVGTKSQAEYERLTMLERGSDSFTIRNLDRLGVSPGWRCLDVGAGAGSVARWLALRAGAANVVATDLSVDFLKPVADLGVRVLRHDVTKDAAPGRFDLVHCRFVLDHLPRRDDVLKRMVSWLKPGGWLLVQSGTTIPEAANSPVMRKAMALRSAMNQTAGTEVSWARTLPVPLERAGLVATAAEGFAPPLRGGSLAAGLIRGTLELIARPAIDAGSITAAELAEAYALCDDPSYVDYCDIYVGAWGRAPI
jgi:SAM-dependent methyltransferase